MERERGAVPCFMEDCSTDERLQQETLCHRQYRRIRRTSRDVDEAERCRHLASVSAGRRSSSHRHVGARPCWYLYARWCAQSLRGLQPVKSAKQQADVVEPRWREYQPGGYIQYRLKSLKKVSRNAHPFKVSYLPRPVFPEKKQIRPT